MKLSTRLLTYAKRRKSIQPTKDIYNAEHPARKRAIALIEQVIEPLLVLRGDNNGLNGEEYYQTEDAIVMILTSKIN